jgi:hypothetical protein
MSGRDIQAWPLVTMGKETGEGRRFSRDTEEKINPVLGEKIN